MSRHQKGVPNWKTTKHECFLFQKGKIYVSLVTGRVYDQRGNSLPADETLADELNYPVPDEVIERIIKIQEELAEDYYGDEIKQAMEEAKSKKIDEIKARKAAKKKADKKPKKLAREEVIEDDEDFDDDDDLDEELEAELAEKPPAKKTKKKSKSKKKK